LAILYKNTDSQFFIYTASILYYLIFYDYIIRKEKKMKKKLLILGIALILIAIVVGVVFAANCLNVHCDRGYMLCNGDVRTAAECRKAGYCTANSILGNCNGVGAIPCPNKANGHCKN
jgi:heme A synthase